MPTLPPEKPVLAILRAMETALARGEFQGFDLTPSDIAAALAADGSAFLLDPAGFFIVTRANTPLACLLVLYVHPESRGHGHGRRLLRAAEKASSDYYLTLKCHQRLRPWYGHARYRVLESHGCIRTMTGPFRNARDWAEYRGRV